MCNLSLFLLVEDSVTACQHCQNVRQVTNFNKFPVQSPSEVVWPSSKVFFW